MHDDRDTTNDADSQQNNELDTTLDALLPVPEDHTGQSTGHDEIDGPIDEVLPAPAEGDPIGDDASTREELEVDTSADGVDDIIPLSAPADEDQPEFQDAINATTTGRAEALSDWAAFEEDDNDTSLDYLSVSDEQQEPANPIAAPASADDEDVIAINEDSAFYASTYMGSTPSLDPEPAVDEPRSVDPEPEVAATNAGPPIVSPLGKTSTCVACGATISESRFCPECGAEQASSSWFANRLSPLFLWSKPLAVRVTLFVSAVLILLALLGDSGANALIISAQAAAIVILIHLAMRMHGWSRTEWIQTLVMLLVGAAAGLPIAWLSARIVKNSWVDTGVLNFGATLFGGTAADAHGAAPFFVWLISGILLPLVAILVIGGAPLLLRMALSMPPQESTGLKLSAGAAAGYVLASAIVVYQPLYDSLAPIMSTSQWTLTIFGLAAIRPMVWVFGGAMIGAVTWRYLRTASLPGIAMPAAIAVGLPFAYTIFSLALVPAGLWSQVLTGVIFAAASAWFSHRFLRTAEKNDTKAR